MARIALTQAGSALGRQILPQSFQLLGRRFSGASLGRRLGGIAANALEDALEAPKEGPRLDALRIMESREGAGIANVYGRMRVAGQLIWASDFTEQRETQGGKGGPRVNTYTYSVSFAVGICEGPGARIDRIWANGEVLDKSRYVHREYPGSEQQDPDPAIEADLGPAQSPAYRGLCYIVFEDFPLEAFGNRIPNLSFEVVRTPAGGDARQIKDAVRSVNLIPATGEFAYSTQPVRERTFPGRERPLNANSHEGRADAIVSLDQLQSELPAVDSVSLTVGWFGDDLRAGECRIRPGVETRERDTVPMDWRAGDVSRAGAYLISQDADGNANYGGTPSDESVVEIMQEMAARGLSVTLTPFLLMDIPPGNQNGQPAFPWRGRITSTAEGTPLARSDVESFAGSASPEDFFIEDGGVRYSGSSSDWGYRRFILHLAWLAKASGVCSAFLIGSEMRALTRIRDGDGQFPLVDVLVELASDVRQVLGPDCKISYAADWSEYGAYAPGNGSNDVLFPLDPLWGSQDIDFIGIDWYPPSGDWRDSEEHLDVQAGFESPGQSDYILRNQTGGEGFDWYYATGADRDNQIRTPIVDTAHGEDWIFRVKDLTSWWSSPHFERPAGVRSSTPTSWISGSKPIRFSEIGFPAIDKGPNSPNLFFDPKSSESAAPPYSDGARDDVLQAQALVSSLDYWQAQPFIEAASVWAWDARPFPAFPSNNTVWSDGENWSYGHWLNGRTGLSTLSHTLADLAARAGTAMDTASVAGVLQGFALIGVQRLDAALEPLFQLAELRLLESVDGLAVERKPTRSHLTIQTSDLVTPETCTRDTDDERTGRLRLLHAGLASGFDITVSEARDPQGDTRRTAALELPVALSNPEAERVAGRLLKTANRV